MKTAAVDITNSDLFLYALYLCGGIARFVDVEDAFIKMWETAPERFSWRKYSYPHYKIAHDALSDITKPRKGQADLLMRTPDGLGRQLTAKGVAYVEERLSGFEKFARGESKSAPDRRPSQRALAALDRDIRVRAVLNGNRADLKRHEAATLLRCTLDSPAHIWRERLETLKAGATAAKRDDLVKFLQWLEATHTEWFLGGGER
jgi:hypothetical protein